MIILFSGWTEKESRRGRKRKGEKTVGRWKGFQISNFKTLSASQKDCMKFLPVQ